jgi:tRNA threonylcarbamoyl adenosine modification protein YjeE
MTTTPAPPSEWLELPTRRATRQLARALAAALAPGDALILSGALGAGKTFLVRALARALGLDATVRVVSPTFTLIRELGTVPPLAHADLYRLGEGEDVGQLGLRELRDRGFVLIVEWGERYPEAVGPDSLSVSIVLGPRRVSLQANGPRSAELCASVIRHWRAQARNLGADPGDLGSGQ